MTGPETPHDDGIERTSVLDAPSSAPLAEALDALAALDPVAGLAPLVRWAPTGEGVSLVHRLPLGARPLAQVRADGPLRLGAAAAIGRGLVEPLRALHAVGLAHGAVGVESVLAAPGEQAVLASTGTAWTVPPGLVGGPDPAADVAALAELVRHLVGITPLPSGLVLVLLRCGDDDPAMRPTLDDLDRALAACLLVMDDADHVREPAPAPLVDRGWSTDEPPVPDRLGAARAPSRSSRGGGEARTPVAPSVLDRPRVLRPTGPPPRRRRNAGSRGRRGLALLGAALVPVLLVARAVGAPALADGSAAGPERLVAAAPSPSAPTPRPTATSRPAAAAAEAPAPAGSGPTVAPAEDSDALPRPATSVRPDGASPSAPAPASGTGGAAARSPVAPAASPEDEPPAAVDWAVVLARLDGRRHAALVAGSRDALARVVDPDGPAWAADAALADRVRTLGARLVGGEVAVLSADLVSLDGGLARLSVVDTRAAYAVTLDGSTARVPARGVMTWEVRLTRAADGTWRIHDVRPAT